MALGAAFSVAACDGTSESTTGAGGTGGTGGAGGTGGQGAGPPTLEVVYGAPSPPAGMPASEEHVVEGYASAVGANGALVVLGTTTAAYQASVQGIAALPIVGDEPDLPLETGIVRAVAPYEAGLLVAADNAVFFTAGDVLQLSLGNDALHPLGISAMTARTADDDGDGTDEEHLTILAKDGAYELSGTTLTKWTVDGEDGAPSAALAQKDWIYLAFGDRVYEVDKTSKTAYPLVFDIGSVKAIACDSLACDEGSLIYLGTDRGLVERGSDGGYSLYPLAAEGDPAVPVETFAFDAGRQRLYALAGDRVIRVHAGEVPEAVADAAKGDHPRVMAFDKLGDLWLGSGAQARSFALGTPLSFATDVKPIMKEYCAECHGPGINGAPALDFEDYDTMVDLADKVIMRIIDGSMPPPGYQKVPKDKLQLLQDWSADKAP